MQIASTSKELESSLRVAYLYFSGMKQKDIARQLRITPSTVSRAISRARHFVELRYTIPGDDQTEARLLLKYPLLDTIVVESAGVSQSTVIVGQAAARYFVLNVQQKDTVALSCGETLLEMVKALPVLQSLTLSLTQLSVEGDPEAVHQSPATLIGLVSSKISRCSASTAIQLPPLGTVTNDSEFRKNLKNSSLLSGLRERALKSRIVFIGAAPVERGVVQASSFMSIKSTATRDIIKRQAVRLRAVGEINNRLYDEMGRDVTSDIECLDSVFIKIVDLSDLKTLVRKGAKVVLVAAGAKKAQAVRAAISSGIANVLITDKELAQSLLQ